MKSGQIYQELEKRYPDRFQKTQIYQSIINLKKSGRIHNEGRIYYVETEAAVHANKIKQWFFRHPDKRIYDSSLARRLEIPGNKVQEVLDQLVEEEFLNAGKSSDFLGREYQITEGARKEIPATLQNAEAIQETIADVRDQLTVMVKQIQALEEVLLAEPSTGGKQ